MKSQLIALFVGLLSVSSVIAEVKPAVEGTEPDAVKVKKCPMKDFTNISFTENIPSADSVDVGALYKAKVEYIENFAKKYKFEDFKIISQDMSISPNCCGTTGSQISMNFNISYLPSYDALTAIHKHSGSMMISTYRNEAPSCD